MFLAYFGFGVVVGAGVGERNLEVGVLDFAIGNYGEVLEYLNVAFIGVEDYVEVFVGAEHLGQHVAERILEYAYHCRLVDVFEFFELGKLLDQIGCFLFLSHGEWRVVLLFEINNVFY